MTTIFEFLFDQYKTYSTLDITLEIVAVIFGFLSVWYSKQNKIWVFPTGMISTLIFVYLLFKWELLGDMLINGYYFIMSIYGWYIWTRKVDKTHVNQISTTTFKEKKISIFDIAISLIAAFCCLYIYFFYDQLIDRGGILLKYSIGQFTIPVEIIIGMIGIIILLEATRRAIGMPLVIIAVSFLLFSYFGRYAPDIISHGGLSLKRLVGFQWFDQEAIFGIPIGVSVDFIFLFVLFGALLEKAGGGKYFLDLAFAMVGNCLLYTSPSPRD